MERLDEERCWRSAPACALLVVSSCFLVASLVLILTKPPSLPLPLLPSSPPQPPRPCLVSAAHLVLKLNRNTSVHRGMLDWFANDVEGAFLGSSFEYSSQKLMIKDGGLYCIYAQVNVELRGHQPNKKTDAVLSIHRKSKANPALLTLHLHLSDSADSEKKSYTNFTSQIYQLSSNDLLYGMLEGSTDYHWALIEHGNFFGVFRINER